MCNLSRVWCGVSFAEPEYVLFAPSTIAIAAVVLSFLYLGEDCTEWLRGVPDDYSPLEGGGGMGMSKESKSRQANNRGEA